MVLILLHHVQGHLGYVETQQFSASFSAGISASFSVSFSVLGYFLWEQRLCRPSAYFFVVACARYHRDMKLAKKLAIGNKVAEKRRSCTRKKPR